MIKNLQKRLKKFFRSTERVRTATLVGLVMLTTAIPLTVYVVQRQQDIRQRANTFQLRSIDVNACGEIISQPAAGAGGGNIVYKAPVKGPDGKWRTVKQDGSIKTEEEIRQKFLEDPRNGGTLEERQQNLATAIGTNYINCGVFINSANNIDCDVNFQTQLPNGSDAGKLPPGGTTTLILSAGTNSGAGCRKIVKTEDTGATPTPTTVTPSATPTTIPPTVTAIATPTTLPPTVTVMVTPTGTITPTVIPTGPTATPTKTPTPTRTPTPTLTPTPTFPKTPTNLSLALVMPGIGKNGNGSPNNASRTVVVQVFSSTNQKVGSDVKGTVSFESGVFKGTVNMGTIITTGSYTIKVKLDQSLSKVSSATTLTAGTTNTVSQLVLTTGDINNDNKLDILDYNILAACFGSKGDSDGCANKKIDADLNDDGVVDGTDYNLFIGPIKKAQKGD